MNYKKRIPKSKDKARICTSNRNNNVLCCIVRNMDYEVERG